MSSRKMKSMNSWTPYRVDYEQRALKELWRLGREDGERLRKDIENFAASGRGDVKIVRGTRGRFWEIRAGLHLRAAFELAREPRAMKVLRCWRK